MLRTAEVQEKSPSPIGGGADKVSKWKWASVGRKGKLQEIRKTDLCVDETYQREGIHSRVIELAKEWWWMACGVLTVVRRPDGRLVIIDGQHRWMAACNRSDIDEMPCIVFDEIEGGVTQEAAAFVKANSNRKTVRASDIFRAKAVAGDEWAMKARDLIESIGRRVVNSGKGSGKTIACVGAVQICLKGNEASMRRIWPLVAEICEGGVMNEVVLRGLHFLESSLSGGMSLTGDPWADKIRRVGAEALQRAAKNYAAITGKGGAKQWAAGIASELNKGMRANKLPEFRA